MSTNGWKNYSGVEPGDVFTVIETQTAIARREAGKRAKENGDAAEAVVQSYVDLWIRKDIACLFKTEPASLKTKDDHVFKSKGPIDYVGRVYHHPVAFDVKASTGNFQPSKPPAHQLAKLRDFARGGFAAFLVCEIDKKNPFKTQWFLIRIYFGDDKVPRRDKWKGGPNGERVPRWQPLELKDLPKIICKEMRG